MCRRPEADGYAATVRVGRDGELEPQLLPGVRIQAATLFPLVSVQRLCESFESVTAGGEIRLTGSTPL